MAEPEVEAAWRAEFERVGEDRDRGGLSAEAERQPAFRCALVNACCVMVLSRGNRDIRQMDLAKR